MSNQHESRYWLTLALLASVGIIAAITNRDHIHSFFEWVANLY